MSSRPPIGAPNRRRGLLGATRKALALGRGGGGRAEPEKSLCGPPRRPEAQSLRRPRCGFLRDTNAIKSA